MDGGENLAHIQQQLMLGTLDVREADFGTFVGGTTQQRQMFCIFGQLVDSSCCVEGPLCIGLQCCLPYYSGHVFSKAKVWHTSIDAYYLFFSFLLFGSGQDLNGDCCFLVQFCGCFFLSVVLSVGAMLPYSFTFILSVLLNFGLYALKYICNHYSFN